MMLLGQSQIYNDKKYYILDLIEASKNLEVINLKVNDVYLGYMAPCEDTLISFIEHCRDTMNADLSFPIILSPENTILDGKHRLAKTILNDIEYIKAVRFKEMPDCGFKVNKHK